jgi:hypothetical protein
VLTRIVSAAWATDRVGWVNGASNLGNQCIVSTHRRLHRRLLLCATQKVVESERLSQRMALPWNICTMLSA